MSINYVDILVSNTEEREEQDKKFNWWVYPFLTAILPYILLVTILATGIFLDSRPFFIVVIIFAIGIPFGWVFMIFHIIYIRAKRVNFFIQRKKEWYETIVEYTGKFCKNPDSLGKLENFINEEVNMPPKKMNYKFIMSIVLLYVLVLISIVYEKYDLVLFFLMAVLVVIYFFLKTRVNDPITTISIKNTFIWIIFSLVNPVPMLFIVYEMPINYLWDKLQKRESRFCDLINEIWIEEGWMTEKIYFFIDPTKRRSMHLWKFLSIVTFWIGICIWDYKIHTDPDNMYPRFYKAEDEMLEVLKKQSTLQLESQE